MSNSSGIVSNVGPETAAVKSVLKLAESNRIFELEDV